jgi:hypothetical protein
MAWLTASFTEESLASTCSPEKPDAEAAELEEAELEEAAGVKLLADE